MAKTINENKINVVNLKGEVLKSIDIHPSLQTEFNKILFKEVLEYHQNKYRINTARVKTKNEIGRNTKPFRQKGTGRARAGSKVAAQHRGGVCLMGPNGRTYDFTISKKKKKIAINMILSRKLSENKLIVVDNMTLPEIKTKNLVNIINNFNIDSCLFVKNIQDNNFYLSMRNLHKMDFLNVDGFNILSVAKKEHLMITESSLNALIQRCGE